MNRINNILIAVELDQASESVIEYGVTLGLMLDAHVRCLHVFRPLTNRIVVDEDAVLDADRSDIDEDEKSDDIEELVGRDLQTLRTKVLSVLNKMEIPDYPVIANVIADFAVTGILQEARDTAADLIVVGAHVDFRRKDLSISNLAKEVIQRADKSVVVVPSTYGNRNLDHICMFVNFEFEELTLIQDMIEVALNANLYLTFVHVVAMDERVVDAEDKINVYRRLFINDEDNSHISFAIKAGSINDIIDELTSDLEVDLIGLRTKQRHWNLFGLQQSFGTKIMNYIRVPLYVWKG